MSVPELSEKQRRFAELHCSWVLRKSSFSVSELSHSLSVSRRTIYRMIYEKKLLSFKVNITLRVSQSSIIIFLYRSF